MAILIDKAKASGDVLLVAPYNAPNGAGSTTVDFSPTAAVLYQLADEKDCALLDLNKRWPADG